jgi:class 3 adenylate cyclase
MEVTDIRYATTSSGLRLAYAIWGEGPPLLIAPALISNVEVHGEHEFYQRTRSYLGQFMTCVEFDKRGIGLSDRFEGDIPTLAERIEDIEVIMDDLGWESAHLVGVSEGSAMVQLFAAEHPDRVETVTLINSVLSPQYRRQMFDHIEPGDAPILRNKEMFARFMTIADNWSTDPTVQIDWEMPSQSGNESFARWMGRLQRFSATSNELMRQVESVFALDAGDAPERVRCPTLIMHVKGDRVVTVAGSRVLRTLIPDNTYVEIEGEDHFAWIMPNWRELSEHVVAFVTGSRPEKQGTRRFATVLFTDIVNSTQSSAEIGDSKWRDVLNSHDRVTRRIISSAQGRVVKSTGDGLLAVFDMPSQAVECALEMCSELEEIGVRIRAGAHAGEIEVHDDQDISGLAVNFAARVEQSASDGEVWVSSTIRDMMLGNEVSFTEQGEYQLKGIEGAWQLYRALPR